MPGLHSLEEDTMRLIYSGKTKDFTPQLEEKISGKLAKLSKLLEQRGEPGIGDHLAVHCGDGPVGGKGDRSSSRRPGSLAVGRLAEHSPECAAEGRKEPAHDG